MAAAGPLLLALLLAGVGAPTSSAPRRARPGPGGEPLSVVFAPNMTSINTGVTYPCIRLPAIVYDNATGRHLAFAEGRNQVGDDCYPAGAVSKVDTDTTLPNLSSCSSS